jgi:hypothetical protein
MSCCTTAAQSKPGLQWPGESGMKEIVLLGGSLTERNLARNAHPEGSLLLLAHSAMEA